jgi:hypothetical protein
MYNYFMLIAELISFSEEEVVVSYTHPSPNSDGVRETTEIAVISSPLFFEMLQEIPVHSLISIRGRISVDLLGNTILVAERILAMKGGE